MSAVTAASDDDMQAEIDSLRRFKAAYSEWVKKTEWFAKEAKPQHLGLHIADAMRLEIESLRAQLAAQGEPVAWLHECKKKPSLRSLSFKKNDLGLEAFGYVAHPLTLQRPKGGAT